MPLDVSVALSSESTVGFDIGGIPPQAVVDVEVVTATIGSDELLFATIDLEVTHPDAGDDMAATVRTPGASEFVPMSQSPVEEGLYDGRHHYFDIDSAGFATTDLFLASLTGAYTIQLDFDRDNTTDLELEFDLDTAGISEADFLPVPTISSPVTDQLLAIDQRDATIRWNSQPADADFLQLYISSGDEENTVLEPELPADATEYTTSHLPTGVGLFTALIAFDTHDAATSSDPLDLRFMLGTAATINFEVAEQTKSISPTRPDGVYGGGTSVVGGVDFEFTGLAGPANLKAEYLPAIHSDQWQGHVTGGDLAASGGLWTDFQHTSDSVLQSWELNVVDSNGNGVGFTHVDLSLRYDPQAIDSDTHTLDEIESRLQAYQFDPSAGGGTGAWVPLQTLSRRPDEDTISVRALHANSFIVLGYDPIAPSAPWVHSAGLTEMEINRIEVSGQPTVYFGNIDFIVADANIQQTSRLRVERPGGLPDLVFSDDYAYGFHSEQFTSLENLIAAFDGSYAVGVDYTNDGTVDSTYTVDYDLADVLESSFPGTPTINSPTDASTVQAPDPSIDVTWQLQPEADTMYGVVHVANGSGFDDDEVLFDRDFAETTTGFSAGELPTNKRLMVGVGASQTNHHRASSSDAVGTTLNLVSFSTVFFGSDPLQAAGGVGPGAEPITSAQLGEIVDAAIDRLADAGLNESQIELLRSTAVGLADLEGSTIGAADSDSVLIDFDAAGHGWYIDPTPMDDVEFDFHPRGTLGWATSGEATQRIDLLTTVMHELGHILGLADHDDPEENLMSADLDQGTRRLINDELVGRIK